jgi:hypothetical protein
LERAKGRGHSEDVDGIILKWSLVKQTWRLQIGFLAPGGDEWQVLVNRVKNLLVA